MKIELVFMLILGFVQVFCDNSAVNSATRSSNTSPTVNITKENTMNNSKSNDAVRQLCQLTIDLPNLQQYFHSDQPGRKPLNVIRNSELKDDVSLTKFGEPVKFISAGQAAKNKVPAIEFTSIEISDKTAKVEFRYAVEGIGGTVEFKFTDKWEVTSSNITES